MFSFVAQKCNIPFTKSLNMRVRARAHTHTKIKYIDITSQKQVFLYYILKKVHSYSIANKHIIFEKLT